MSKEHLDGNQGSRFPRCFIYGTPNKQLFQVQTAALRSLASAHILMSVVSLASKDTAVPVDRRTCLCFPLVQTVGHLGEGDLDTKVLLPKSRLKNNHLWEEEGTPHTQKEGLVLF